MSNEPKNFDRKLARHTGSNSNFDEQGSNSPFGLGEWKQGPSFVGGGGRGGNRDRNQSRKEESEKERKTEKIKRKLDPIREHPLPSPLSSPNSSQYQNNREDREWGGRGEKREKGLRRIDEKAKELHERGKERGCREDEREMMGRKAGKVEKAGEKERGRESRGGSRGEEEIEEINNMRVEKREREREIREVREMGRNKREGNERERNKRERHQSEKDVGGRETDSEGEKDRERERARQGEREGEECGQGNIRSRDRGDGVMMEREREDRQRERNESERVWQRIVEEKEKVGEKEECLQFSLIPSSSSVLLAQQVSEETQERAMNCRLLSPLPSLPSLSHFPFSHSSSTPSLSSSSYSSSPSSSLSIHHYMLKYLTSPDYPPPRGIRRFAEGDAFLNGCKHLKIKKLGSGVQAIVLPVDQPAPFFSATSNCPNVIYIRDFYPALLSKLMSDRRCILISNSGVGKSVFQFYMMAVFSSPEMFSDQLGLISPPELIIRQVGSSSYQYYLLNENISFLSIEPYPFELFDSKRCIFLHEPVTTTTEPDFYSHLLPIISTVSPLLSRYKEFSKNGGIFSYMPLFTLEELSVIGADMREREDFPPKMKELYSDENINNRFKSFGGIIRHVLPKADNVEQILQKRETDINNLDCLSLLNCQEIQSEHAGHLILAYQVERSGESAFRLPPLVFVSEEAQSLVEMKAFSLDRFAEERILLKATQSPDHFFSGSAPKVFEEWVAKTISSKKAKWNCRFSSGLIKFHFGRMKVSRSMKPYSEMEPNRLYFPQIDNFPFTDLYFKRNDSELVCIQLCFGRSPASLTRNLSDGPFMKFCERLGLSSSSTSSSNTSSSASSTTSPKILFLFCPHPNVAPLSKIRVNNRDPPRTWKGFDFEWGVIHLPEFSSEK